MPVFSRFLRYFMSVAKLGSIRKASEALRIVALFERLPTGLRRGQVNIALPDALAQGFLPDLLLSLRRSHPGITVRLHVLDNQDIPVWVVDGRADMALWLDPVQMRGIVTRVQREYPLGFICPPDHPLARQREARFSLCADLPMVMPEPPLALHRQIEALEIETGLSIVGVVSADNVQMIRSLVMAGMGVGILSALDVAEELARGALAFVPISNRSLSPLTLALCVDRARQLSGAARQVLAEIEARIGHRA